MPLAILFARFVLVTFLSFPLILSGCSYLPWADDDEDDLAFEEDFPFEDEEFVGEGRKRDKKASREDSSDDDFFGKDDSFSDSDGMAGEDGFADDESDGFGSVNSQEDRVALIVESYSKVEALFIRHPTGPITSITFGISDSTSDSFARSAVKTLATPPWSRIFFTTFLASELFVLQCKATDHPSLAIDSAIHLPMRIAAPVIKTTFVVLFTAIY